MRRREFVTLVAAATTFPLGVRAQQVPVVGYLNPAPAPGIPHIVAAFRQGLADEGYVDGKNLAIESRFTAFRPELMYEAARDLVRRNVNVLFASTPDAVAEAKSATSSIPIVGLDFENDPVALGYVKSLARPGGNLTGMYLDLPELSGKQVGLLKEIAPQLSRIAVFGVPKLNEAQFAAAAAAVRRAKLEAEIIEVQVPDDWTRALDTARTRKVEAGILLSSPVVFAASEQIGKLAVAHRLPLISLFAEFPMAGGLIAYGPNVDAMERRAGVYVGKILHGAHPNDLPIERPAKFDLMINLATAKALGLEVPLHLQQLADEVIE
jgi:putative ABC transport system substrate-binding protein